MQILKIDRSLKVRRGWQSITPQDLQNADKYEVAAYKRVALTLRSSARAWVYVDARYTPPS